MKLHPDSPELTAYVLGEAGPGEAAAVEAAIAADPALAAEVAAIRAAAGELSRIHALEFAPELTASQRERIARAATGGTLVPLPYPRREGTPGSRWIGWLVGWRGWGVAMAGAVALALTFFVRPRSDRDAQAMFSEMRYRLPDARTNLPSAKAPRLEADKDAPSIPRANAEPGEHRLGRSIPAAPRPAPKVTAQSPGQGTRTPVTVSAPMDAAPPAPAEVPSLRARKNIAVADRLPEPSQLDGYLRDASKAPRASMPKMDNPSTSRLVERDSSRVGEASTSAGRGGGIAAGGFVPKGVGVPVPGNRPGAESYRPIVENPFHRVTAVPLSTFGLDVDTASYANVRRFIREGSLPPRDAVRIEEMVNYFRYDVVPARGEPPVTAVVDVAECPWKPGNRLARVTVKAREVAGAERPPANLVFLVDVSGSMEPENKLPLVQRTLRLLVDRLTAKDRVGIVTYAGDAAVALPSCNGAEKGSILAAIDGLRAAGSTHGSAGIRTAYAMVRTNLYGDGVNRVILCTDGDFNVGATSQEALLGLVREEARSGVSLTVLGYGMDNYRDQTMQLLADNGNGHHAYIDSFREAQKVIGAELESTWVSVAKDAKLQVEFNPERVSEWRLIGYEKRLLADRDFNDDTTDAGDLGAGHTVTALYELVPAGGTGPGVDPLRYRGTDAGTTSARAVHPDELLYVKLRYKEPGSNQSRLAQCAAVDARGGGAKAATELRFASAVAGFGMLLRNSAEKGQLTYDLVLQLAEQGLGDDREGYRGEFIDLVRRAKALAGK